MLPSKSREHRIRVLEHQARLAGREPESKTAANSQLRMPLFVAVKDGGGSKKPRRRARRKSGPDQPKIGDL
jgi:hypothetical protein